MTSRRATNQRDQRRMAPAVCWNWGEWRLKEYKWKGSFLGLVSLGSSCRFKRLLSCQVQNIFSLTVHYFNLCVPIVQQPEQAVVQGRLSLNVCLCHPFDPYQYAHTYIFLRNSVVVVMEHSQPKFSSYLKNHNFEKMWSWDFFTTISYTVFRTEYVKHQIPFLSIELRYYMCKQGWALFRAGGKWSTGPISQTIHLFRYNNTGTCLRTPWQLNE